MPDVSPIVSEDVFDPALVHAPSPLVTETLGIVAEARPGYAALPAPFYNSPDDSIQLFQADALDLMRRMGDESFDMIFADPPYFLSNGGVTCVAGKMVSVNKGQWDKSQGMLGDHSFNILWLDQCHRLLKPNGTIWVTGTSHNIYSVGHALQTLGYKILNDIAWYKVNPPPNLACRYFTHATETVLWAAKSAKSKHVFHYPLMKEQNGGKQMQSLWHIQPPGKSEKRHGKHPTQKPEALLWRIVAASTNPGDMVLDPFCGSATTGVACARLGRRFVGIEREEEHLQLAVKRLADECAREAQQPSLHMIVDDSLLRGGVTLSGARGGFTTTQTACRRGPFAAGHTVPAGHAWQKQGLGRPHLRGSFGTDTQFLTRTERRQLGTQAGVRQAYQGWIADCQGNNGNHHALAAARAGQSV